MWYFPLRVSVSKTNEGLNEETELDLPHPVGTTIVSDKNGRIKSF